MYACVKVSLSGLSYSACSYSLFANSTICAGSRYCINRASFKQFFTACLQTDLIFSCSFVSMLSLPSIPVEAFSIIGKAHEMLDFSLDSRIGAVKAVSFCIQREVEHFVCFSDYGKGFNWYGGQ